MPGGRPSAGLEEAFRTKHDSPSGRIGHAEECLAAYASGPAGRFADVTRSEMRIYRAAPAKARADFGRLGADTDGLRGEPVPPRSAGRFSKIMDLLNYVDAAFSMRTLFSYTAHRTRNHRCYILHTVNTCMKVSQTLEEKVCEMDERLSRLESAQEEMDAAKGGLVRGSVSGSDNAERMSLVVDSLEPVLREKYRGRFVALTYDGKIIESADSGTGILEKLNECPVPRDQRFIYGVPLL